jgi:cyanate permease
MFKPDLGNRILMYMGIVNTGYATSFFTPTILTQLGWKSIHAQVMSIPIFIVATILALTTAVVTDRLKHRFGAIIIGCCVATTGYAILLNMEHVPVSARYFALYLITGGGYIAQPVTIVWLSNNMGGHYKRGWITLRTLNTRSADITYRHLISYADWYRQLRWSDRKQHLS